MANREGQEISVAESPVIRSRREIKIIIDHLTRQRSKVAVSFAGIRQVYSSMMFDANSPENEFILDELLPKSGNILAREGTEFALRTSDRGIKIYFPNAGIASEGRDKKGFFYRVPLPRKIHYQQRRGAFRALVVQSLNLRAEFYLEGQETPLVGALEDISAGGCRMVIADPIESPLVVGQSIRLLRLSPAEDGPICMGGEVRHCSFDELAGELVCGIRFVGMNPYQENQLSRLVTRVELQTRLSPAKP